MFIISEIEKKQDIINKIFKHISAFNIDEINKDIQNSDNETLTALLLEKYYVILVKSNIGLETLLKNEPNRDNLKEFDIDKITMMGKHIEQMIINLDVTSEFFEDKISVIKLQIKDYITSISKIFFLKNFVDSVSPTHVSIPDNFQKVEFVFELNKNRENFNNFYNRLTCIKSLYESLMKLNNINENNENNLRILKIEKAGDDFWEVYGLKEVFNQTKDILSDYIYSFNSSDSKFEPIENKLKEIAKKSKIIKSDTQKKLIDSVKRALRSLELEYCSTISIDKLTFSIKQYDKPIEKRKKLTETMNTQSIDDAREALREYMIELKSGAANKVADEKDLELKKANLLAKSRNVTPEDIKTAQEEFSKGLTLISIRRYSDAIVHLDNASSLNPTYPEAYNYKGICYSQIGNYMEAIKAVDNAIAVKNDYKEAYLTKGMALFSMGRHGEAVSQYKIAIDLDKSSFDAYYNIGNSLMLLDKKEDAIKSFSRAIEINPTYAPAYYNRACAYVHLDKNESSLEDLENAIKLDASFKDMIKTDPDFNKLKQIEKFNTIVG